MSLARKFWSYAWASPNSFIGLVIAAAMILLGAEGRRVSGALEIGGGLVGAWLGPTRIALPWRAITLGHVILGIDATALPRARARARATVRAMGSVFPAGVCGVQPVAARLRAALLPRQLVRAAGL
jgi:hypothetical protein